MKVVFRDRFPDARPYEREFYGIQNSSRSPAATKTFIDILQIGRNDAEGYFYYVMELAEDAAPAGKSDQCAVASDECVVISPLVRGPEARQPTEY